MPDFTTASAMLLIMSSLTLQANLFHEFHPMGGVCARFAEGEVFSCATVTGTQNEMQSSMQKDTTTRRRLVFMQTFYQKYVEIGRRRRRMRLSGAPRSDLQCPIDVVPSCV